MAIYPGYTRGIPVVAHFHNLGQICQIPWEEASYPSYLAKIVQDYST
jgi:hypothetical protein